MAVKSNEPVKLRCIAVDDETFSRELLADNIRQIPYLELVGVCKNAVEAIEMVNLNDVDVIFIDIQMPGISGLQFVKNIRPSPIVIFVTAYEKYAVEAFAVDAIDYLLKPVTFERFLQATNKALLYHNSIQAVNPSPKTVLSDYIFVNADYNLVKVVLSEVTYIEGSKDYIKIFSRTSKHPLLTKTTMRSIEELLPTHSFIRIHRSYIVAIAAISIIKKDTIMLVNNIAELPIGDNYKDKILLLSKS